MIHRISKRPVLVAVGLAASFLVSCSRHVGVDYASDTRPRVARATASDLLDYVPHPIELSNHDQGLQDGYDVKHLAFASAGRNGQPDDQVTGLYYRSRSPGKKALIVVLPIWGSSTYPPKMIGKMIRKQSDGAANVFVMEGEKRLIEWAEIGAALDVESFTRATARMAERLRISGIDVRRFLDWAEIQPDVDTKRMGLVGFSVGAVVGAVIAPHEPRFASTVLVMGGGRPGDIFAHCDGRAQKAREAVTARFGWTVNEYRERVTHIFDKLDPVRYGDSVDPGRVILFDAERDECIPRTAQDDLWEALGRPRRISMPYGHKVAFLAMTPLGGNFIREEIWGFLDRTLMETDASKTEEGYRVGGGDSTDGDSSGGS